VDTSAALATAALFENGVCLLELDSGRNEKAHAETIAPLVDETHDEGGRFDGAISTALPSDIGPGRSRAYASA
jgi:hypothetical protein